MLERFGATTGAWKTVFSNDLTNLLPGKIDAYDAIFLNSIVGELFADPAVRASVATFVKNGGGSIGIHGTPWASRNWDEFTEMIGSKDAPHRIEQGIMRVYDRESPLDQAARRASAPLQGGVLPLPHRGRAATALERRSRPADGRPRRSRGRATAVDRLHPRRQDLPGLVDPDLREGTGVLHLDRTHARDVHDAQPGRPHARRGAVRARRPEGECHAQSVEVAQKLCPAPAGP